MLRSFLVIGIVIAFIASAFTVPTDQNYKALAETARSEVRKRTADVRRTAVPASKTLARVAVKRIRIQITGGRPGKAWKAAKGSSDPVFVQQLERIEWATKKQDVRLCKDVLTADAAGGKPGDYLALCLARVTGDYSRCMQIDPLEASLLKHLCDEELAT